MGQTGGEKATMVQANPEDVIARVVRIARSLTAHRAYRLSLDSVVDLAHEEVPGCVAAGVLLVDHDHRALKTPAVSEELVIESDALQHVLGEGPCWDAAEQDDAVFFVPDLAGESRWPRYAPRAVQLGIRSIMAYAIFTDGAVTGALNLYGSKPHAFNEESRELGWLFASHAAVAVAGALKAAQLQEAMKTREGIGAAVGILMERHRLSADQAFDVLRRASQESNIKLRHVAARVLETGESPSRKSR